jgi:hypothetical protein
LHSGFAAAVSVTAGFEVESDGKSQLLKGFVALIFADEA